MRNTSIESTSEVGTSGGSACASSSDMPLQCSSNMHFVRKKWTTAAWLNGLAGLTAGLNLREGASCRISGLLLAELKSVVHAKIWRAKP